ncbi:hypothetical protein ACFL1X_04265 [Candidatus Hydrogenedentota bacterium]
MGYEALLSALPALPDEPEEDIPIQMDQFWWRVGMEGDPVLSDLVEAVLLMRGVVNILMAVEGKEPSHFATLSRAEVKEPEFYPEFAESFAPDADSLGKAADGLWERYFEHAFDVARECESKLFFDSLTWEVGLRNALVEKRSAAMNMDASKHLLLEDYSPSTDTYQPLLADIDFLKDSPDKIAHRVSRLRLEKLEELTPWASNSRDAVVCYALKLMVLKHASVLLSKERTE